jgi:hypothetical protein
MIHNYASLQEIPPLAIAIAAKFSALPQVVAVANAGSRTSGVSNTTSDFDFFVYVTQDILVTSSVPKFSHDSMGNMEQVTDHVSVWLELVGCDRSFPHLLPSERFCLIKPQQTTSQSL